MFPQKLKDVKHSSLCENLPEQASTLPAAEQEKVDEADKETSPAKKVKVSQREVPMGTKLSRVAKDGNCLYNTWIQGLAHLEHAQKDISQLQLRANVAQHLTKWTERYKPLWDGKGPDGTPLDSWDDFVSEVSKKARYASDLELRALCRLHDGGCATVAAAIRQ